MYTFEKYTELLSESLDTPVEFFLTDDTEMPRRIYAYCTINGTQYGMSLVESTFDKIYLLNFYRILAKKPRPWSFKKASDIRPAFSTLLKFAELCIPHVKTKMNGILCKVSSAGGDLKSIERYIKFADRLIRRKFIKSFRVLPNTKSPDAKLYDWENIFISRLGVSPKSVFMDSKFKNYNFDDQILTHEISADIIPKRKPRPSVSTERSKKYTFSDIETENLEIDDEVFERISKLEPMIPIDLIQKKEEKKYDFSKYNIPETIIKKYQDSIDTDEKYKYFMDYFKAFHDDPAKLLVGYYFTHYTYDSYIYLCDKFDRYTKKEGGIEKEDIRYGISDLIYVLEDYSNEYSIIVSYLRENKYFSTYDITYDKIEFFNFIKKYIVETRISLDEHIVLRKIIENFQLLKSVKKISKVKIHKTNLDPKDLKSTIPESYEFDYENKDLDYYKFGGDSLSSYKPLKKALESDDAYNTAFDEALSMSEYSIIKKYTGDSYSDMNQSLRSVFSAYNQKSFAVLNGNSAIMTEAFEKMPPTKEQFWVYRSTAVYDEIIESLLEGKDYVDPAFLSTSIMPSISFGLLNLKLRIFIPKGSKIIPILSRSKNAGENEIILPPFSVLKPIRIDQFPLDNGSSKFLYVTAVYMGTVVKDFMTKAKEKKVLSESEKPKKDKKYDPNDKYGSSVDPKMLKQILQMIKTEKMKPQK
jgi:hypothetical protein